jgi:transformation/transcription domain-associated protein
MELRDFVEVVQQHEYDKFLRFVVPPFFQLLKEGSPSPTDALESRSRNLVLEIFSRLPFNEGMRPHSKPLLKLLLHLLSIENEENGLICLRVIVELHKVYRNHLEAEVNTFIEFATNMFTRLPQIVKTTFSQPLIEPAQLAGSLGASGTIAAPGTPTPAQSMPGIPGGPGAPGTPGTAAAKPAQAAVLAINSFKVRLRTVYCGGICL